MHKFILTIKKYQSKYTLEKIAFVVSIVSTLILLLALFIDYKNTIYIFWVGLTAVLNIPSLLSSSSLLAIIAGIITASIFLVYIAFLLVTLVYAVLYLVARKKQYSKLKIQYMLYGALILLFIHIGLFLSASFFKIEASSAMYHTTQRYIRNNSENFHTLFENVFDQAKQCNGSSSCEKEISEKVFSLLLDFDKIGRQKESTYFIKLQNDDTFEVLFLSGKYEVDSIDTAKKRQVQKLLNGNIQDLNANKLHLGDGDEDMRYLNQLKSKFETIIPVKKDGKTIGAVVRLY
jgi:hypothetical protein